MAFRDDRDAQLARAEALERENARLKAELERRDADAASALADAEARGRAAGAERVTPLAEENASLRDELARVRGPGVARRIAARIAALQLAAPSGDGGYGRAALEVWRIHVPIAVGLLVTAPIVGMRGLWLALLYAVASPCLAALLLVVPWLLRRRRRVVAGALAAGALGPLLSLAFVDPLAQTGDIRAGMVRAFVVVVIALVGMTMTRGTRPHALMMVVIFTPLLALPQPAHFLMWIALGALGAELAASSDSA